MPDIECLATGSSFQNLVTGVLENFPCEFTQHFFIFDDQNSFAAASGRGNHRVFSGTNFSRGFRISRQINGESGTATRLALNIHPAIVLAGDIKNRREAEAGAFSNIFGRKKRFKNVGARRFIHAATGVGDFQFYKMSNGRFRMNLGVLRPDKCFGNFYNQRAAIRHRVTRVTGEIHDDLFNHALIGVNEW